MTARILVVDDIAANVKLLEARLSAEYFEVLTASSGRQALAICARQECDIVLLDVMMPEMDGLEACRHLKQDPRTAHIPVIIVTALDQPADRIAGLDAGADDFLTKPVNDIALITRVKSLSRLKVLTDELRMRAATGREINIDESNRKALQEDGRTGRVLLVDDRPASRAKLRDALCDAYTIEDQSDPQTALFLAAEKEYDLLIISMDLAHFDSLRLCSQIRALERTRLLPILMITSPDDNARLLRALDLGINDYVVRPLEINEIRARIRTQIRRKKYTDRLREDLRQTLELAIIDQLTGLHNRRYLHSHLETLLARGIEKNKDLSVLMLDIDYFKSVNDSLGHEAGDEVLQEVSARIRKGIRGVDLACRYGGEEFVVVLPETDLSMAVKVGERLRRALAEEPVIVMDGTNAIAVTASIGISSLRIADDSADQMLKRADAALYCAKRDGRNRIASDAA